MSARLSAGPICGGRPGAPVNVLFLGKKVFPLPAGCLRLSLVFRNQGYRRCRRNGIDRNRRIPEERNKTRRANCSAVRLITADISCKGLIPTNSIRLFVVRALLKPILYRLQVTYL